MVNTSLGKKALVAYTAPGLPIAVLEMPLIIYIVPFYAAELGVELAAIGGIFLIARLWDAVTDPLIGNMTDRTRSRWGRRKPWIAGSMPILVVGFFLLFLGFLGTRLAH